MKTRYTRVENDLVITYLRGLADENKHIPIKLEQLCVSIGEMLHKEMKENVLRRILKEFGMTCVQKTRPRGTGIWARYNALEARFEHLLTWAKAAGYEESFPEGS